MIKLLVQFASEKIFLAGFSQTVGVRQGCTLSPDLFNLFLEHILSEAKQGFDAEFGIRNNGERFTDLCFADDIDIMSETVESAQSMLQQIHDASSRYGMEISKENTVRRKLNPCLWPISNECYESSLRIV